MKYTALTYQPASIRLLALFLLLSGGAKSLATEEELPTEAVEEFVTVLEQIKRNYVFEQSDPVLIETAIRGMVSSLDPYSRYLNAQELRQFESSSTVKSSNTKVWDVEVLDSGIVYLDINFFHLELADRLTALLNQRDMSKGLIIDLRDNGGGFVDSAVAVADLFLNQQLVVHTRGRTSAASRYLSTNEVTPLANTPLVVVVNEGTASAAEIFSAAIQDHKAGLVLGNNTYGKGSIQSLIYTRFGAIQITTSLNYRPSGGSIQGVGIRPDIGLTGDPSMTADTELSPLMQALIKTARQQVELTTETSESQ